MFFKKLFSIFLMAEDAATGGEANNADGQSKESQNAITDETEIDIGDGNKLPLAELKKGYMRQSDYTKKTTEVAMQRKENAAAVEFYDKFKKDPESLRKMQQKDDDDDDASYTDARFDLLQQEVIQGRMASDIEKIVEKDPDVDVEQLLDIAEKLHLKSVKDAYDVYKGRNQDKIIEKKLKDASVNMTEEIKKHGLSTTTIIPKGGETQGARPLSGEEKRMAAYFNMTEDEYRTYSNPRYNPYDKKK